MSVTFSPFIFMHRQDEECIVDPDTNLCIGCGVEHGEACGSCGGRAFHKPACPLSLTVSEADPEPTAAGSRNTALIAALGIVAIVSLVAFL